MRMFLPQRASIIMYGTDTLDRRKLLIPLSDLYFLWPKYNKHMYLDSHTPTCRGALSVPEFVLNHRILFLLEFQHVFAQGLFHESSQR